MAEVVLLSDYVNNIGLGHSRYMGPYAVASSLQRAGIDVIVIDYFLLHPNIFEYIQNFIGPETVAIGISSTFLIPKQNSANVVAESDDQSKVRFFDGELFCHTGEQIDAWLAELSRTIHPKAPNCKIVLGGTKAIRAIVNPSAYQNIDYVCLGGGDEQFLGLVTKLKNGIPVEANELNGKQLLPKVQLKTQTAVGCPDSLMCRKFAIQFKESLPIEVSRGCLFNCKFCHYEKRTSIRKPIDVLEQELIRNYELFGTTIYHITDDCFNDQREKVESICNMFLRLPFKIEWVSYARTDVAIKFPHTSDLMVAAGARALYFGIESLNSEVARRAGKGTPTEKVKEFLLDFRAKHGDECLTQGSFIVGLPGEDRASILQTIDFLCRNEALDSVAVTALEIVPFAAEMDMKVIDYSDYSRNPEKYGFKKVSFGPNYWEHEHMASTEAYELAAYFVNTWKNAHSAGALRNIFNYPHLRTLGYTHNEITTGFRSPEMPPEFHHESARRFKEFLGRYFDGLVRENCNLPNESQSLRAEGSA